MDIRQLQAFIAVRDHFNFTKAAAVLDYAQSSITAQIQQLESELDTRLFERIGKTIALTDAGARLAPYAEEILRLSDAMRSAARDTDAPSGTLVIGTSESLSISRLPPILSRYRRLYPGVELGLKLLGCGDFLPNLSRNAIDLAYAIGTRHREEAIDEVVIIPEPILVLAPPGHSLAGKQAVTIKDLQDEPLLLTGPGCAYGGAFRDRLNKEHIAAKTVLETESVQVIKQAAVSGLGICVLPAVAVTEETALGTLVPLNFDTSDFGIVSQLLVHRDKWRSPALRAFLDLAKKMLND
jgi:DNA-binding transcriptional LysR family regulator